MRIRAGDYELVEHSQPTNEIPLFSLPGILGAFTYLEAKGILKAMGLKLNEIGPIIGSRGDIKKRIPVRIRSQLERNQPIMRKLVDDDKWQK